MSVTHLNVPPLIAKLNEAGAMTGVIGRHSSAVILKIYLKYVFEFDSDKN